MRKKAKKGEVEKVILSLIEKQTRIGDFIIEELLGSKKIPYKNTTTQWFVKVRCAKCNARKVMRYHNLISPSYAQYTKCKNKNVKFFDNQTLYFPTKNVGANRFPLYDRWYMMTHLEKNMDNVCPEWRCYKARGGHYCTNENFRNYMNYENYIVSLLDKHKYTLKDVKERHIRIHRKVVEDGWFPGNICLHVVDDNKDLS